MKRSTVFLSIVTTSALALSACSGTASTTDGATAGTDARSVQGDAIDLTDSASTHADAISPHSDARADRAVDVPSPPDVIIGACNALPSAGTWNDITPPEVRAGFGTQTDYGTFAFVVDPVNSGTVYLGTIRQKVWKSTDCGANWVHIDTGRHGDALDPGMNWTFAIDPLDPQILYTNAGYGNGSNGLLKSTNGGVDWDIVWPPSDPSLSSALMYNFANTVVLDPHDHTHLLLTFHERCLAPHAHECIAESNDAGASWRLIDGDSRWTSDGEGIKVFFLEDSDTWLWGSQADGMWRTADHGQTWSQITGQSANHLQSTQALRTSDGTFIVAGFGDLWRSPRGTSAGTWVAIPNTGPLPGGIVSDGTTLYMSNCYYGGFCPPSTPHVYFSAPESDPDTWTPMDAPPVSTTINGAILGYDRGHHLLYSTNLDGGMWRLVLP